MVETQAMSTVAIATTGKHEFIHPRVLLKEIEIVTDASHFILVVRKNILNIKTGGSQDAIRSP